MEYIIVGDTEKYENCLVFTLGKTTLEKAQATLKRILENPSDNQVLAMKGYTNLRVDTVEDKSCWWNDSFLAN